MLTLPFASNKYIDPDSGDDSNDGSVGSPWEHPTGGDSTTGVAASYSPQIGDTSFFKMYYDSIGTIIVTNNTFSGLCWSTGAIKSGDDEGLSGDTLMFSNNILHNSICTIDTNGSEIFTTTICDNNAFYSQWDSASCVFNMALSVYQSKSVHHQSSVYAPLNVTTYDLVGDTVESWDFHLLSGSSAIGIGADMSALCDLGACVDYDSLAINNPPDAGAYRYGSGQSRIFRCYINR